MKIKLFLFLITLHLSFISTFFTSNVSLAVNHEDNNTELSQTTINLNKSQLEELIDSIDNTKQESINIETTDDKVFKIEIQEDEKSLYEKYASIINLILGTFIGAVSTLLIGLLQDEINKKKQRISNTFELAKDWDSQHMRESRTMAWKAFSLHHKNANFKDYYNNTDEHTDEHSSQEKYAIKMLGVVDFFDRLTELKRNNLINKNLAKSIFTKDYKAWKKDCFTHQNNKLINDNSDIQNTFNINKWKWLNEEPYGAFKQGLLDLIERLKTYIESY